MICLSENYCLWSFILTTVLLAIKIVTERRLDLLDILVLALAPASLPVFGLSWLAKKFPNVLIKF